MIFKVLTFCFHILVIAYIAESKSPSDKEHGATPNSAPAFNVNYIEIDHELVPRKIENINNMSSLPVPPGRDSAMKKFPVFKRQVQEIILEIEENKGINKIEYNKHSKFGRLGSWKNESEIRKSKLQSVIGTQGEIYYDADWGLMSAVLTCYNNHWALRTGPEDWWTVVIRKLVQAINDHGEVPQVRDFFVEHKGKKRLEVLTSLQNINYNKLFSLFSKKIRENIKVPGYVDIIENDFSSTTAEQKVISNIMLMSSVKKYFDYGIMSCGIPGIEMKGTEQDWVKLVDKLNKLVTLLAPINKYLHLTEYFNYTATVFDNLLDTYRGNPNIEWWTHILSWNANMKWGSGTLSYWSGWFPEFVGVDRFIEPSSTLEFYSGIVTVPIHIEDGDIEDDGILAAGIVGFNVEEGVRAPVVEPTHAWSLLLPEESPVADRLTGGYVGSTDSKYSPQNPSNMDNIRSRLLKL